MGALHNIPPRAAAAAIAALLFTPKDWFMNVEMARRVADILFNHRSEPWSKEMDATTAEIVANSRATELKAYANKLVDRGLADNVTKAMQMLARGRDPIRLLGPRQAKRLRDQGFKDVNPDRMLANTAKLEKLVAAVRGKRLEDLKSPAEKAMYIFAYDTAHLSRGYPIISPEGETLGPKLTKKGALGRMGGSSNVQIAKAVSVLEDHSLANISAQLGNMHKIRNFYNNLIAPGSPHSVTIDTHAVAAAHLEPFSGASLAVSQNFGSEGAPSSKVSGFRGTYPFYHEAYRRAAEERGIIPREMQSVTWEAVRGYSTPEDKRAKVDTKPLWMEFEDAPDQHEHTVRSIVSRGIAYPSWHESAGGSYAGLDAIPGIASDHSGGLPDVSVSRERLQRASTGCGGRGGASGGPGRGVDGLVHAPEAGDTMIVTGMGHPGHVAGPELVKSSRFDYTPDDMDDMDHIGQAEQMHRSGGTDVSYIPGDALPPGTQYLGVSSPNTEERPLSMEEATADLKGEPQQRHISQVEESLGDIGKEGEHRMLHGYGDWAELGMDGERVVNRPESSMAHLLSSHLTDAQAKVVGSLIGLRARQKGVLLFRFDPAGPQSIHRMLLPGVDAYGAREVMDNASVPYRTILPAKGGSHVMVYDPEVPGLFDSLVRVADAYRTGLHSSKGYGEILADAKTRNEAAEIYRSHLAALGPGVLVREPRLSDEAETDPVRMARIEDVFEELEKQAPLWTHKPPLEGHANVADWAADNGRPALEAHIRRALVSPTNYFHPVWYSRDAWTAVHGGLRNWVVFSVPHRSGHVKYNAEYPSEREAREALSGLIKERREAGRPARRSTAEPESETSPEPERMARMEDVLGQIVPKGARTGEPLGVDGHNNFADWLEDNGRPELAAHVRRAIESPADYVFPLWRSIDPMAERHGPYLRTNNHGDTWVSFSVPHGRSHVHYSAEYPSEDDAEDTLQRLITEQREASMAARRSAAEQGAVPEPERMARAEDLVRGLRQPGREVVDPTKALQFADWLEDQGWPALAHHLRTAADAEHNYHGSLGYFASQYMDHSSGELIDMHGIALSEHHPDGPAHGPSNEYAGSWVAARLPGGHHIVAFYPSTEDAWKSMKAIENEHASLQDLRPEPMSARADRLVHRFAQLRSGLREMPPLWHEMGGGLLQKAEETPGLEEQHHLTGGELAGGRYSGIAKPSSERQIQEIGPGPFAGTAYQRGRGDGVVHAFSSQGGHLTSEASSALAEHIALKNVLRGLGQPVDDKTVGPELVQRYTEAAAHSLAENPSLASERYRRFATALPRLSTGQSAALVRQLEHSLREWLPEVREDHPFLDTYAGLHAKEHYSKFLQESAGHQPEDELELVSSGGSRQPNPQAIRPDQTVSQGPGRTVPTPARPSLSVKRKAIGDMLAEGRSRSEIVDEMIRRFALGKRSADRSVRSALAAIQIKKIMGR